MKYGITLKYMTTGHVPYLVPVGNVHFVPQKLSEVCDGHCCWTPQETKAVSLLGEKKHSKYEFLSTLPWLHAFNKQEL